MWLAWWLGIALAADELRLGFEDEVPAPSPATFPGALDAPPVDHWSRRLPGGRVNAATHTERTEPVLLDDGTMLVGAAGGSALYRLSRRDGDLLATYPANDSVESPALVVDDRLWFADTDGTVWAYTLEGEELWSRQTAAPILVRPTLDDGRLYVTTVDDLAVALDADTGELLWRYQHRRDPTRVAELTLYGAPAATVVGDSVLFGFSDGALIAVDATRGELQWERSIGEGRYPDVVAQPVVHEGTIYASGYFEPLVAMDVATQNVRWRVDAGAASAVLVDDSGEATMVYHPGTDGTLRAIVALTGAEKWAWDSGTGGALTTPVRTDAGLVVGSSAGTVYLIDPETGQETWRRVGDRLLLGLSAAPAVDGRQLVFVTNAGRIYSMLALGEHPPRVRDIGGTVDGFGRIDR